MSCSSNRGNAHDWNIHKPSVWDVGRSHPHLMPYARENRVGEILPPLQRGGLNVEEVTAPSEPGTGSGHEVCLKVQPYSWPFLLSVSPFEGLVPFNAVNGNFEYPPGINSRNMGCLTVSSHSSLSGCEHTSG